MQSIEISSRTIDEAISEGLQQLGVSIGDVTVDILEEGSKGLFGFFGSRPARVRLTVNQEEEDDSAEDVKAIFADGKVKPVAGVLSAEKPVKANVPQKAPAAPQKPLQAPKADASLNQQKPVSEKNPEKKQPEKKQERKPAPVQEKAQAASEEKPAAAEKVEVTPAIQRDPETPEGKAQLFLQNLTKLMGVEVAVHADVDEEGNVRVNMQGDTLGILIGRRGETLDALQYLTSLQVNKGQSNYTRVTLDTENYRAKREEALIRLANRMANRAQKTGRRVSLEAMNPYERRIMHSALQDNPAVETHSEGEEPNRHVVITLKK